MQCHLQLGEIHYKRFKEHQKLPSPIYDNQSKTGQSTSVEDFKIMCIEGNNLSRYIKESISIRVYNPTVNRNMGKYNLRTQSQEQTRAAWTSSGTGNIPEQNIFSPTWWNHLVWIVEASLQVSLFSFMRTG